MNKIIEKHLNTIIYGDCLEVLPKLPRAKMIFADPPDNLGMTYESFEDYWPSVMNYTNWLTVILEAGAIHSEIFWLSYYHQYQAEVFRYLSGNLPALFKRQFIWRFTFGQHRDTDFANGYRPILRLNSINAKFYPDTVRIQSQRQRNKDKRANPKGRVPDDVWDFPRVCGTFKERKKWHPCQHPKALLRRIVLFSTAPGDLVIDMFAGSGNMLEVCKELDRKCIGIEISKFYCEKIAEETGAKLICRRAKGRPDESL